MRLLLDENLDWRLQRDLPAHQVDSVALIGWAGIENGDLLKQAVEAGFEVLITMDSRTLGSIQSQWSRFDHLRIDWLTLAPLMPALLALLPHIKSGAVTFLPS